MSSGAEDKKWEEQKKAILEHLGELIMLIQTAENSEIQEEYADLLRKHMAMIKDVLGI